MSAYVRQLIDGELPQERPPLDFYKMLTELRYIGNNMNQLTRIDMRPAESTERNLSG